MQLRITRFIIGVAIALGLGSGNVGITASSCKPAWILRCDQRILGLSFGKQHAKKPIQRAD